MITLLLFFAAIAVNAQYNCVTWDEPLFGMPDELNRGRLKVEGMRGDNPDLINCYSTVLKKSVKDS